jgi:CHC2 zinc finger
VTLAPNQFYQDSSPHYTYGFRKCCEAIREAVSIQDVARRYTDLEPLGGRAWFTGRCPLPDHDDKTPSFYIYPPGRFYCYGCGRNGDVVDLEFFCGHYDELWEAMIALSLEYGVELPKRPESWVRKQERQAPIRGGIEHVRREILRRRLFRWFMLPLVDCIEDEEERRQELERAWEDFREVPLG